MRNMYNLWIKADHDLLSTGSYSLLNTGQGLNRVQACPKVGSEMRNILNIIQSKVGPWVGLSVVHLGDRDVPNALIFIDKYTQIPRMLQPIVHMVENLSELFMDEFDEQGGEVTATEHGTSMLSIANSNSNTVSLTLSSTEDETVALTLAKNIEHAMSNVRPSPSEDAQE